MRTIRPFAAGTRAVVHEVAREDLRSLVGGGETADAVLRAGKAGDINRLSTVMALALGHAGRLRTYGA